MNGDYATWKAMDREQYQAEKQAMIERCFDDLERYIPGIRAKCDWVEAAPP